MSVSWKLVKKARKSKQAPQTNWEHRLEMSTPNTFGAARAVDDFPRSDTWPRSVVEKTSAVARRNGELPEQILRPARPVSPPPSSAIWAAADGTAEDERFVTADAPVAVRRGKLSGPEIRFTEPIAIDPRLLELAGDQPVWIPGRYHMYGPAPGASKWTRRCWICRRVMMVVFLVVVMICLIIGFIVGIRTLHHGSHDGPDSDRVAAAPSLETPAWVTETVTATKFVLTDRLGFRSTVTVRPKPVVGGHPVATTTIKITVPVPDARKLGSATQPVQTAAPAAAIPTRALAGATNAAANQARGSTSTWVSALPVVTLARSVNGPSMVGG